MKNIKVDLSEERIKQIEKGYTPELDAALPPGQLSKLAGLYANAGFLLQSGKNVTEALSALLPGYPKNDGLRLKQTPRENLVIAGALIIAAIEDIDRKEEAEVPAWMNKPRFGGEGTPLPEAAPAPGIPMEPEHRRID